MNQVTDMLTRARLRRRAALQALACRPQGLVLLADRNRPPRLTHASALRLMGGAG